jgi:Phage integrase, N-terminal SAM-like domain
MTVKQSSCEVIFMSRKPRNRPNRNGEPRYTAYYWDAKGDERSAGTFATKGEAKAASREAEVDAARGRGSNRARGRMKFQRYVEDSWLPNHVMEHTTRESHTCAIYKHILPEFGNMRLIDIHPGHVREWITKLQDTTNLKSKSIKIYKAILSAIFTTAFNDQIIYFHPCRGVKTPPAPRKPLEVITPKQFDCIYQALPNADAQLLVEADIESGLRWGELIERKYSEMVWRGVGGFHGRCGVATCCSWCVMCGC